MTGNSFRSNVLPEPAGQPRELLLKPTGIEAGPAQLWSGDEPRNFDDGTRLAVQGRAGQEPQQVLGESLRVQDVGDVLLSGQDPTLYIG